jgi:hypothetical protein
MMVGDKVASRFMVFRVSFLDGAADFLIGKPQDISLDLHQ